MPESSSPRAPKQPAPRASDAEKPGEQSRKDNREPARARPEGRVAAPRPERPIPAVTYPEDLPVSARRQEIARAIAGHQVVIVSGETGSGKTTQLPKICLELGRGRQK